MDGHTIDRVLRSDAYAVKHFRGVLTISENQFWPTSINPPASYVINTDVTEHGKGEHWVAAFFTDNGRCEYFDSYGTAPLKPIFEWVKPFCSGNIIFNKKWIQSPVSRVCGVYVVFFLLMRSRGVKLDQIIAPFQNEANFVGNDLLVLDLIGIEMD